MTAAIVHAPLRLEMLLLPTINQRSRQRGNSRSPPRACEPTPGPQSRATHSVCPPPPAPTTPAFRESPGIGGFSTLQPPRPGRRPAMARPRQHDRPGLQQIRRHAAHPSPPALRANEQSPGDDLCSFARNASAMNSRKGREPICWSMASRFRTGTAQRPISGEVARHLKQVLSCHRIPFSHFISHIRIILSLLPEANRSSTGEKATHRTPPRWAESSAITRFVNTFLFSSGLTDRTARGS